MNQSPRPLALSFPLHGSRLIEASAGTGKTYTISALYLRLILGHGGDAAFREALLPPQILVVTFTDAATRELRDRIRARLVEAAVAHDELDPGVTAYALMRAVGNLWAHSEPRLGWSDVPDFDIIEQVQTIFMRVCRQKYLCQQVSEADLDVGIADFRPGTGIRAEEVERIRMKPGVRIDFLPGLAIKHIPLS